VHLAPKTYDVLVALVRRPGHLVTKRELLGRVWPNVSVEEGILTVHVSSLRRVLGDITRSPLYIETVSRSGYRFIAAVTRLNDQDVPASERWSFPAFAGARS
jgi:DNA-binding winged helix-turn-helix (wHTH) protein